MFSNFTSAIGIVRERTFRFSNICLRNEYFGIFRITIIVYAVDDVRYETKIRRQLRARNTYGPAATRPPLSLEVVRKFGKYNDGR